MLNLHNKRNFIWDRRKKIQNEYKKFTKPAKQTSKHDFFRLYHMQTKGFWLIPNCEL